MRSAPLPLLPRLLLVLGLLLAPQWAAATGLTFGPDVLPVTDLETMQQQVVGDQFVWLVLFYKPADPGTTALRDVWAAVAAKSRGYLKVGAIDVQDSFGASLMKEINMQQTPAILGFPSTLSPGMKVGAEVRVAAYQGPHKVDPIVAFGVKLLPDTAITRIKTAAQLEAFLAPVNLTTGPPTPKALLLSAKDRTSPLYKGLSVRYVQRLQFGELRQADAPDICERLGVESFPTLLVFDRKGEEPETFGGEKFDFDSLGEFLDGFALTGDDLREYSERRQAHLDRLEEERKQKEEEEARQAALRDLNPTLRVHTEELWQQQVLERGGITLVAWLDPGVDRHKEYLRTLKKVWKRVQSGGTKFHFVWVDGVQQHALAEHFGVAADLPVVTFLHPKNGWWKLMIGAFEEGKIWRYARDQLLKGAGQKLNAEALPPFAAEQNPDGLKELDPAEEEALLTPKPPPKTAAAAKEPAAAPASPAPTAPTEAEKPSEPKKKKAAGKVAGAAEERNRQREAEKAAQRQANEERRLREKAEREAKLEAERQARRGAKRGGGKRAPAGGKAAEGPGAAAGAKAGATTGEPKVAPTNAYFEALKRRQKDEL